MTIRPFVSTAHAAFSALTPANQNAAPAGGSTPNTILSGFAATVIGVLLQIAGVLAVVYLVWAGVQYITAGGDPGKAKLARSAVINGVIGITIILSAYVIIRFAGSIANTVTSSV